MLLLHRHKDAHTQCISLLLAAFESFLLMKSGVQINSVGKEQAILCVCVCVRMDGVGMSSVVVWL